MFKNTKIVLTATIALLPITAAQSAFLPIQDTYTYESVAEPATEDLYYQLPFSISGVVAPTAFWCALVNVEWKGSQPLARNRIQAGNRGLSKDGSTCFIIMPKNMASGMYEATLSYQGQSQTYSFIYKDNEPIQVVNQNSEYKSGDQIYISFNKPYSKLVPLNLSSELTARNIGGDDYLVVEGSISSETTSHYTFQVYDLESDQKIDVNFTVTAPEKPEEEPDDGDNKIACNTTHKPKNGANFVFRYRTGAICS
ncbi:hypothetical protein IPU75_08430 [Ochrobactrum sp. SD129]|nr:hypothetical protein [Ochrobactrum sp. SD129]